MMLLQALLHGGKFNGARDPQACDRCDDDEEPDRRSECAEDGLRPRQPIPTVSISSRIRNTNGAILSISTQSPVRMGRSAGSVSWAGLLNCYFWIDPVRKVTGSLFTQLLPFYDDRVVALYGDFERGLYDGLA